MDGLKLLRKMKPRGIKLENIETPPALSVYLMLFIAIIGIVNLLAMVPSVPKIVLMSPMILAMIFGGFYPRYKYLPMILLVDLGWYIFGDKIFLIDLDVLHLTLIGSTVFAIGTVEVVRFFWNETVKTADHLTRLNDFVDELDVALSSVSNSYVLRDGIIETLRLATERFFLSGAYLYMIKDKDHPVAVYHSKYEDANALYENEVLFQKNISETDLDVSRLIAELSHKDILISSAASNTAIGKKLRKKFKLKSIVFVALHEQDEIIGFLVLLEHIDTLNINSLDYRVISIIRSLLEISLASEKQRIYIKRLERTGYEFTKVALKDARQIINGNK